MSHQAAPAHGRLARVPGTNQYVDSRILPDVIAILRRFKVKINAGYAPTGHSANGEHPRGLALDIVPDFERGGSWADVDRLARWAEPKQNQPRSWFRWVGYDGDADHGRGDHLHLSWNHSGDGKRVSTFSGSSGDGDNGGLVKGFPDVGDLIPGNPNLPGPGDIFGGAADAAGATAEAMAKTTIRYIADAIGEAGARILLYIAFVVGGAALVLFGLARTMGVRPANVADVAAAAATRKPARATA